MKKVLLIIFVFLMAGNLPSHVYARDLGKREIPSKQECYEAIIKGTKHQQFGSTNVDHNTYYIFEGFVYYVHFVSRGFGGRKLDFICRKWNLID